MLHSSVTQVEEFPGQELIESIFWQKKLVKDRYFFYLTFTDFHMHRQKIERHFTK